MGEVEQRRHIVKRLISRVALSVAPLWWKRMSELYYWKAAKRREQVLGNDHYKPFYTDHFGLDESFYQGKVILDIGCGPRGSLEWANMAARRMGLDPLADQYLKLGAREHRMDYLCAPSEQIPLPDATCDVVFSFNSLDHVEDVDASVREIARVTKPGGRFLLIVEVNHEPTDCEPHCITPAFVDQLAPAFICEDLRVHAVGEGGVYASLKNAAPVSDPRAHTALGYLSASFRRA